MRKITQIIGSILVGLLLIGGCIPAPSTATTTPTPAVAFWVESQTGEVSASDAAATQQAVDATNATVVQQLLSDGMTQTAQAPVATDTPVPTATPAPTITVDADPLRTAYSAELAKLDSREDLVQNGVNPSNPPGKYRVVFTGHGMFTYGNKQLTLPYHTPCDTATTSECRLYILVLENLGTPGGAPINFVAKDMPEGGASSWEYRQGEMPNLAPLWQLPLRDFNHCGYNCGQVVVVEMLGDSTTSGDEITVSAVLYNRDGTSRDFTADLALP